MAVGAGPLTRTTVPARPVHQLARDPLPGFNGAPRLEAVLSILPDGLVVRLLAKVHAIELFEDVLELVREQRRGVRRDIDVDAGGNQVAALERHLAAGGDRGRPRLILGQNRDFQLPRGGDPGALTPERGRTLPEPVENRAEWRRDLQVPGPQVPGPQAARLAAILAGRDRAK